MRSRHNLVGANEYKVSKLGPPDKYRYKQWGKHGEEKDVLITKTIIAQSIIWLQESSGVVNLIKDPTNTSFISS